MTATTDTVDRTAGQWVFVNLCRLTLYLAFASFVSALALSAWDGGFLRLDEALAFGGMSFVIGGIGCLPGLPAWLFVVYQSKGARHPRAVAVATAPLAGLVWLVGFALGEAMLLTFLYGVFWPLGAGLVVTLPSPPSGGRM